MVDEVVGGINYTKINDIVRRIVRGYGITGLEEQRVWSLGDWRVYIPAPVRFLIPYGDDVLVVTGIYGGIYSVKLGKWLFKYDRWFDPSDYEYVPGDGLDTLILAGFDSKYLLKYDGEKFEWIETPASPTRITRPYGFSEETTKEVCYFLAGDQYVYSFNPRTNTVERKTAMFPRKPWATPGAVGRAGKAYFGDNHDAGQDGGIWEYDPATDTLTRKYSGSIIMLRQGTGSYIALEEYPAKGRQLRLVWTRDFSSFKTYILPESVHFRRGVIEFGSSWNVFKLTEGTSLIYARGIVYSVGYFPPFPVPWTEPNIAPLFGSPLQVNDIAWYEGGMLVALAGDYRGDKYWSIISLLDPSILLDVRPPPAYAVVWDNQSISAGETSLPIVTAGWSRISIYFTSDTAGTLTIEADPDGDGVFRTYDTVSIPADTTLLNPYLMTGNVAFLRLSFDTAATVTAKITLMP